MRLDSCTVALALLFATSPTVLPIFPLLGKVVQAAAQDPTKIVSPDASSEKLGFEDRICLAQADGSYTCASRSEHYSKMEKEYGKLYNFGVKQRIDGTDKEKEAIIEVLTLMKNYFFDEVLVQPVYEGIQNKWYVCCTRLEAQILLHSYHFFGFDGSQNYYDLCAFWAALVSLLREGSLLLV